MKKLFFFKSSTSSSGNNNPVPPPTCTQAYWENPSDTGVNGQAKVKNSFRSPRGSSKTRKDVFETQTSDSGPCLRRSLSFSSTSLHESGLGQKNASYYGNHGGSPHMSSNSRKRSDSFQRRALTPERQPKSKSFEAVDGQNVNAHCDSSECSSHCSSNVSNKVLDRYIDGEQEQERSAPESHPPQANHMGNRNCGGKRPPRAQYTAPDSPTYSLKAKPKSQSFRDFSGTQLHFSSRDWAEHGFGHESPRRLAKHVVERLSQSRGFPKKSLKEFDPDLPITIEDIYGGSLKKCTSLNEDGVSQKSFSMDGPGETTRKYQHKEISTSQESNYIPQNNYGRPSSVEAEEEKDVELLRKSKKAEERFLLLSEELEQEHFLEDSGFSMTSLIQTVRDLSEERVMLAHEVSAVLQAQIADRASTREEISKVRAELDSRTRRLEKEKSELQSALEKELDRRSNDWSFKLEKYQAEEHRLRERVRELAEQNVSLQRDVSSLSERETENRSRITSSEQQFNDLSARIGETTTENQHLRETLSDLQHKYRAAEEDRGFIKRNYEEKDKECKDMHRSITRLQRTCSEQEKTIDGLRKGLSEEVGRKGSLEKYDKQLMKLQMEQIRLTGVEQALRKEIECHRQEVDSLRHENISLLQRLKVSGKEGGFSTFKLDQELLHRVCCMQNQGLSLLNESTQLCAMLVEYIKSKAGQSSETKHDTVAITNALNEHFIVESGMKVQGFKRGIESLTRNLQTISTVLNEKSNLIVEDSHSHCSGGDELDQLQRSKELMNSKLKAEVLLTSLLREKLYSKELELEQLQAELAAAVRGNDTLKCEVQNALDNFSCMTHKMKDLELQMMKKDEEMNRLQDDLQDCRKELGMVRGILPQVSDERDLMWQEVKQYSERNMLLNSEVNALKKKIEALDEDILLKEGQISILKDSLGKPFDLLASPELV